MAWRKWFVRGVVFSVVGCCAAAGYVYQQWTNPEAVREQVLANLQILFPGAYVDVDAAHLRLMGGIQLGESRLVRRDDPDRVSAVQIPSSILYHDKEKLLDGELSLRKVELTRPRFRIHRMNDGSWNLAGMIGEQRLDRSIPTVVIHQGILLFEDRTTPGNITSLEITDFNMILINDPIETLTFEGVAQSPLVGKVTVSGTFQRATNELTMRIATRETPLGPKLIQRLAPWCPRKSIEGLDVVGEADTDVAIAIDPRREPSVQYDAACRLRRTSVTHPLLPLPLDNLEAALRFVDGELTLETGTAMARGAKVSASGSCRLPEPQESFQAQVAIERLVVADDLVAWLPDKVQKLIKRFQPRGMVSVKLAAAKDAGSWVDLDDGRESVVTVLPEGCSAVFDEFPYPIEDVTGTIDYQLRTKKVKFHLGGMAGGQSAAARGQSWGVGDNLDLWADIQAANLPIDDVLVSALPPGARRVAESFHATGRVDAVVALRHRPGNDKFENTFHLNFRDCNVAWEPFPLPLNRVSGRLDILPAHWEFHEFRGHHGDGLFQFQGRSFPVPGKDRPGVRVELQGTKIELSAALEKALAPMPSLQKAWQAFRPSGVMQFSAIIHRPSDAIEDLDVRLQAEGASVMPAFFPYQLTDCRGVVHVNNSRIDIGAVSARHGSTLWTLPRGRVDLKPAGGYHAELPDVDVQDLQMNAELIHALPAMLQEPAKSLELTAPVRLKSRLVVAQGSDRGSRPDIYWNAQGWLSKARFVAGVPLDGVTGVIACRGRHDGQRLLGLEGNLLADDVVLFKQPYKNVQAHFHVDEKTPETLLAGLSAPQYGGDITGELRVDFQTPVKYELNLTAAQIDLAKFGQQNLGDKSQMEGKAVGRLHLTGTGAGVQTLDGNGSIDVVAGKLYNLPLILDLLKFLGLRWPDRTAFEEVHALFRIKGPKVTLRKLELQGNAVSLSGQGDFHLDGTKLHVDFYPTWARIDQMLPPVLRNVPPAVSKNFLIIEMRGKVSTNADELKFQKKIMPIVFDPILNVRDRVIGWGDPRRVEPLSQRTPTPIGPTNEGQP